MATVFSFLIILLAACSKPLEKVEEIRPVRVMRIAADNADVAAEFSGEIRSRIESRLGFRVGGKIVSRQVDVGTVIKRGQILMQLDPQDLQLVKAQANAGLKAAESNRDLARDELKRYQDLHEKKFVSQTVLDSKETAFKAAQASYEQALAGYRNQSNQAGYSTLVSDVEGVVTGIDAEVGQVVQAGTAVVRVAQAGEKEIVFGIPEDKVDALRHISDVKVRTWANPQEIVQGKLREVSPVADPSTRTYNAKVSIPNAPPGFKLGMTAHVTFLTRTSTPMIKLPSTAVFQKKATTAVWVVDKGVVQLTPVQVAGSFGNDLLVTGGVASGQIVVTAGVNSLNPGQKVKILNTDSISQKAVNEVMQSSSSAFPLDGQNKVLK